MATIFSKTIPNPDKSSWVLNVRFSNGGQSIWNLNFFKYSWDLYTVTIWILNTWIPDSMGVQYSNGKVTWLGRPFKYQTIWTINSLFSIQFSDNHLNTGPFDNRTQIYHLNTRLVWHSDGYCTQILLCDTLKLDFV